MIVPMKKAHIAVLKSEYDKVIKSLQQYGVIMIINKEGGDGNPSLELNEALKQKVDNTIKFASKYEKKKGLFGNYQVVELDKFNNVSSDTIELVHKIEEEQNAIQDLLQEKKALKEEIDSITPWENLDIIPNEVKNTKHSAIFTGYIQNRHLNKFKDLMDEFGYTYEVFSQGVNGVAIIAVSYYKDKDELSENLKKIDFSESKLPGLDVLVKDHIESLKIKIKEIEDLIKSKEELLEKYASNNEEFKILSDQILSQKLINDLRYETTLNATFIEGWVRSDQLEELEKSIKEVTEIYEIELTDPLDDDVVPTYTKNEHFVSQFETITDMFSKPNSKEVDPNPVMSWWYWFLFGMMMGDVGYGILILVGGFIIKKILRPKPKSGMEKLINVITYSGIPTIFWGIMFGSYFGLTPGEITGGAFTWYWFNPMDDPIQMLFVSIVVGALHLITGLIVKIVICFKEKSYAELLSKNLSWILIMAGIGAFFINSTVGLVLVIIGVALILLFGGAHKKGIIGKFAFGLLGLYDVTSYLGDLLSYSRIMALVMSSAAVATVMNTLASMVGGGGISFIFSALIFVVGHIFNLVLGLLSAYVHDSRLQYIEFFGKFYEGGGVDFKPLSIETKHINEIK